MTSYLLISQGCSTSPPTEAQCTRSLGLGYKLCTVAGQRTHGTTFRALEVTSEVATPGAESAVYDCLVFVFNNLYFWTFFTVTSYCRCRNRVHKYQLLQMDHPGDALCQLQSHRPSSQSAAAVVSVVNKLDRRRFSLKARFTCPSVEFGLWDKVPQGSALISEDTRPELSYKTV